MTPLHPLTTSYQRHVVGRPPVVRSPRPWGDVVAFCLWCAVALGLVHLAVSMVRP